MIPRWLRILRRHIQPEPAFDPDATNLGAVLMKMGLTTPEQISTALALAQSEKKLIGQALVETGVVTEAALKEALEVQARLRSGREVAANLIITRYQIDQQHRATCDAAASFLRLERKTRDA